MNLKQVYNLVISDSGAAKELADVVAKKQPPNVDKYIYLRCLYKSVVKTRNYHEEYEKIIQSLFDKESEYTAEFINYLNQFLKTLVLLVSFLEMIEKVLSNYHFWQKFFKEFYKVLGLITEGNIPADSQVIALLFSAAVKNNLYIIQNDQQTAKENQTIVFRFIKSVLNKTKDFELFAVNTLKSKNFLYFLKTLQTSKEFFDSIDFVNIKLPTDLSSFIKDLSSIIAMVIQFVDFDSAKMLSNIIHENPVLHKQHELVLYRRTMNSNDEQFAQCMKFTSRLIYEKKAIISNQILIIDNIINSSLIQFSKDTCEQTINVFMGVLQNFKDTSSEYNYFPCCTSFRQHICITVFVCSLKLLVSYLKSDPNQELSETFETNIGNITDYFLETMKKFQCSSIKQELRLIRVAFSEASNAVTSQSTARFLIFLFQDIFAEEKCQNIIYTGEEVRAFIILFSKVDSTEAKKSTFLEELNALYVGHLLNCANSKEKIKDKIIKYYMDTNPTSTILEVIEKNESHRKPKDFDAERLRREERNVCIKWFKHMIPKLADTSANDLDYVSVAMEDKTFADHDKLLKIQTKVLADLCQKTLDNEVKAEKYLTLAYATKIEVSLQISALKGE